MRFRISKNKVEGYLDEEEFDNVMDKSLAEADEFFWKVNPMTMADDLRNIQRQALAGMMWCKQ